MIKLIKNVKVYSPDFLGVKDVLILGDKLAGIEDEIKLKVSCMDVGVYEARG